jgi:flagellar protein FliS
MAIAASYRFAREYQRSQVETSSPVRLVVMLYDGAIRFLSHARERMAEGKLEERHSNLIKAQNIIAELLSSLDIEQGGDVALNLKRVYTFMLQQLVEANLYDKMQPIDDVIRLLRELRESWIEIDCSVPDSERENITHASTSASEKAMLSLPRGNRRAA